MSAERHLLRASRAPSAARIVAGGVAALAERLARDEAGRAFERGRDAGRAEAAQGAARALEAAVARLEEERDRVLEALAGDAVGLAVAIARTLVRAEIEAGRADVERIVRETLAASGVGRGACVVHLHPADAARLERVSFRAGTRIEADHEVARGDVHVTTPWGVLVRDVDASLDAIAERIRGEFA